MKNLFREILNLKNKKIIIFGIIFSIILIFSGIVIAVPALETIYGQKNFVNGIMITDANTINLDPNGGARVKYLAFNMAVDSNYVIKSSKFTVDPNGAINSSLNISGICDNTSKIGLKILENGSYNGVEIGSNSSEGIIQDYDRNASVYRALAISGSSVKLQSSNVLISTISSTGLTMASTKGIGLNGTTADPNFVLKSSTFSVDPNGNVALSEGAITTINGLKNYQYSNTLADDAILILPTSTSGGYGIVTIGDDQEFCSFRFSSAGVVVLREFSANISTSEIDGKFCIYDGGSSPYVKNTMGSSLTVKIDVKYN